MDTDKVKCSSCRTYRETTLFKEGFRTCDVCRDKIKAYKEEHREEVNEQRKLYALLTVRCEVRGCDVKRNEQAKHKRTKKHLCNVNKTNEAYNSMLLIKFL